MNRLFESSIAVRTLRWLGRESAVARAAAAAAKRLRRLDEAFARAAEDKASRFDSDRVEAIVSDSRLMRAIDQVFSAPVNAWEHSRIRFLVDSVRSTVAAMALWERIRLLGWMLAVALITRGALYVASGAVMTVTIAIVWAFVLAVAAFMAAAAPRIAMAWHEWKRRKRV